MKKVFILLITLLAGSAQASLISATGLLVDNEIHDYYFSTTAQGVVTIKTTLDFSVYDYSDTEINLFFDDVSLDLTDFIANNDDSAGSLASFLELPLAAGNYLLRVGTYDFGNDDGTDSIIIGATNPNGGDTTAYSINISGGYVSSQAIPEPAALLLFGLGIAGIGFSRKKA